MAVHIATAEEMRNAYNWSENLKASDHSEDLVIDGKLLQRILTIQDAKV
jgi:hypothetical protein